jgi:putative SOS response-associated peptidase YedK
MARLLEATLAAGLEPEVKPHWNVSPQRTLFAVAELDGRVLDAYRWGLLPSWAKDHAISNKLFNARGETVAEKPSFRSAFAKRPCAIPVDGFYEWDRRISPTRQPHYFTRTDGEPIVLAGLYEFWWDKDLGEGAPPVQTCTVITTTPNADIDGIHDRMPVVLELDEVELWLETDKEAASSRLALIDPAPDGTLEHYPVGTSVGNVRNDGPELIAPLDGG